MYPSGGCFFSKIRITQRDLCCPAGYPNVFDRILVAAASRRIFLPVILGRSPYYFPIIPGRSPYYFMEGLGKVQPIVKAYGGSNGCDGQGGMLEEVAGLLDAESCQVFFGRFADDGLKGTEQVAPANPDVAGNVFYRNRVRIIGGDIGNGSLYITASRIGMPCGTGMLHKERKGAVKAPSHFH